MLWEDGSKKRMFNHIKRLMRKQEQRDTRIKFLNGSGIIVNDEQEVVKKSGEILGQFVLHKLESDPRTEKGDDWKWYDK